jgi:hypothetical protein
MKLIFFLLIIIPCLSFGQTSHYDSLYNAGLISKSDYQLLQRSKTDTNAMKLSRYDSLYKAHQITDDEYKMLKKQVFEKSLHTDFDENAMKHAVKSDITAGIIGSVIATGFIGFAIGEAVNRGGPNVYSLVGGLFGGLSFGIAIGSFAHGGRLMHRIREHSSTN